MYCAHVLLLVNRVQTHTMMLVPNWPVSELSFQIFPLTINYLLKVMRSPKHHLWQMKNAEEHGTTY